MSRTSSTDAPHSPTPPPPSYEGHLRSGKARSLPVTAGDQGDPTGGLNTPPPPGVRIDDGFVMASSASGPRTTPMVRAMVVEGTPLRQEYRFAAGSYSPSDDEDDSPPLLSGVEPSATLAAAAGSYSPSDDEDDSPPCCRVWSRPRPWRRHLIPMTWRLL